MSYDPLDLVLSKLERVKKTGAGYTARCPDPNHNDRKPSLSVGRGDEGQVLLKCHAGCNVEDIVAAMGLTMSDLYPDRNQKDSGRRQRSGPSRIVECYDYTDEQGALLYQNCRKEPKDFIARRPDGNGGWIWSLNDVRRVPFNLAALSNRKPNEPIFLCEGEKDALRLTELGQLATCHKSLGGDGWMAEWNRHLAGNPVVILRDNDRAGIDFAERSASAIHGGGIPVTVVALPGLPVNGDVSDWLDQGRTVDELIEIAESEPKWQPEQDGTPPPVVPLYPPFPTDVFPPRMRALCEQASGAFGYPADYVALPALAALGTMAGGSIELVPKFGWFERIVGWYVQIGDPGSAKSPAQELALAPVQKIQRELYDYYKTLSDNYFDLPKNERKGDPPDLEVLMTTDTTIEGVAKHHRHSLLIAPDELTAWLAGFNRYRGAGASERGQWLSLWALTQIVVSRASRGAVIIPLPTVNVTGGIQPDRLRMLLQDAKGDSMNDGFLDRLLPCWPVSDPPDWTDARIDERTVDDWAALLGEIRQLQHHVIDGRPGKCEFDERAKVLWEQFYNANNRSTKDAQGMGRGWSAKAPRHLARLTLALHVAGDPQAATEPIPVETLEAGIELVDWFRGQHGLMLSALGAGESSKQAGITTRIKRILANPSIQDDEGWISYSDLYRKLRNVQKETLREALATLIEDGSIEPRRTETGTKPRDEYRARTFSFSQYSQNSQSQPTGNRRSWDCACGANNSIAAYPDACPACGAMRSEAAA